MKYNEVTIWTSEPDYEEYRTVLEEDFPQATEEERRAFLKEANDGCLAFQQKDLDMYFGMPVLILEEDAQGCYRGAGYLENGSLAACLTRPEGMDSYAWIVDERGDLRLRAWQGSRFRSFIYRLERPDLALSDLLDLESFVQKGRLSRSELCSCTLRLGDAVAMVYGLDLAPDDSLFTFTPADGIVITGKKSAAAGTL